MKKGSPAASSPSSALESASGSGRFVCSMCSKAYRSGAGLRYHKRKRHRVGEGIVEPSALHRVKCQEPGCTYQMLAISDLRNHLSNHHHKPEYKCTEEKKFTSIADFTEWKSSFEASTSSKYVKNCGAKGKSDNQTTEYYYCNRTGPFGQGLRRSKVQGSLRGGIHCTSSMKVEIQTDEHVTVQYYPSHYGHTNVTGSDDIHLSENSMNTNGTGNGMSSPMINTNSYPSHGGDCSSSSSPGSASSSPSGGSNSNSNQISTPTTIPPNDRYSMNIMNTPLKPNAINSNHHSSLQNAMSHCIVVSPSFMLDESTLTHSNQFSTPVFFVQQQQQHQQQQQQQQQQHHHQSQSLTQTSGSISLSVSNTASSTPVVNGAVKKEKCVSDIMRETFQLLSYWPLDHHHGLVTTENEHAIHQPHVNMDEHLMF